MASADIDLKNLLEQSRMLVRDTADSASKLVFEVGAAHYWTTYSTEIVTKLISIGQNIEKMLDFCEEHWGEGNRIFQHEQAMKLWQTSAGLTRAVPPIRVKLMEHLARRRRQRIMGQNEEEDVQLEPAVIIEDQGILRSRLDELVQQYDTMAKRIAKVPDLLHPPKEPAAPPVNGKMDDAEVPRAGAQQDHPQHG